MRQINETTNNRTAISDQIGTYNLLKVRRTNKQTKIVSTLKGLRRMFEYGTLKTCYHYKNVPLSLKLQHT